MLTSTLCFRRFSVTAICLWLFLVGAGLNGAINTTQAQTRAYVAHAEGFVTVIDTDTSTVVTTITVCSGFTCSPIIPAVTPNGARVYVTSISHNTVTNTASARIAAGGAPPFVGVTPDGTRLYVDALMAVTIIDTSTNTIVTQIPLGLSMGGVAFGTLPPVPRSKEDCKDGGYQQFGTLAFPNQGQCLKYVKEHAN